MLSYQPTILLAKTTLFDAHKLRKPTTKLNTAVSEILHRAVGAGKQGCLCPLNPRLQHLYVVFQGPPVFGSVAGLRSLCASNRVVLASRIVGSQQLLTLSETSRADTNTNIATVI